MVSGMVGRKGWFARWGDALGIEILGWALNDRKVFARTVCLTHGAVEQSMIRKRSHQHNGSIHKSQLNVQ